MKPKPPFDAYATSVTASRRRERVLLAVAVALLALGVWLGRPPTRSRVGEPLPRMTLPVVVNGVGAITLGEPSPVVLEFFASWCGNCRRALPELEALARSRHVRVIAVSVDDTPEAAGSAAQRWGVQATVVHDETGHLTRHFGVTRLPTTVVIGADGRVADLLAGVASKERLSAALSRM